MGNPFVHVELKTTDVGKAFYRGLFDWKLEDMDVGGGEIYTMIGGHAVSVVQRPGRGGGPLLWFGLPGFEDLRDPPVRTEQHLFDAFRQDGRRALTIPRA